MDILKNMTNVLWAEWFWLPTGYNWTVFSSTNEASYPDFYWIYMPIPFSIVLFLIRIVFERHVCMPVGRFLDISDIRPRPPVQNPVLEQAYAKRKKMPSAEQLQALSKQVDMNTRQVERWFRQRRAMGNLSQLQKFSETGWRFFYYTSAMFYGFFVLVSKPWFYDTLQCWLGYPYHTVDNDVWWYYMIEMSFYWSLLISQFFDVKRKDFWQMFAHHVTTILLMVLSWTDNLVRVGTLVLLIHDIADVFLEAAKLARYANRPKLCEGLFALFAVVWIITRLIIYPYAVVYGALFEACQSVGFCFPAYYVFNALLVCLQFLHLIWTWYIVRIAIKSFRTGQTDDARSDTDEDLDVETSEDNGDVRSSPRHLSPSSSPKHSDPSLHHRTLNAKNGVVKS